MPSFVVIIGILSLVSFLYSFLILHQEVRGLQLLIQPFGGTPGRFAEQGIRLIFALLLMVLSVAMLLISAALLWLGFFPSMIG